MAKGKTLDVKVHFTSNPRDVPAGLLTRCLFGMSPKALAAEISTNKEGKWDDVYAEA